MTDNDLTTETLGTNPLDFTCQEAQAVLLDRRIFMLDEEKFQQFGEMLDAQPSVNENLRQLLTTPAPWD